MLFRSLIGLSDGTTWTYISNAAPTGGFLRGRKYDVSINNAWTAQLKDRDNNNFGIVTIGMQTWMAENLKTTKYNDGTAIPNITNNTDWGLLGTGAYCDYNNTSLNSDTYGRLYNWFTVDNNASTKVASNGGKNICPTGWHVPTYAEWTTLTYYLGGQNLAGYKLKETGTTHWTTPNTGATNETGFTALPGGYRFIGDGAFYYILTNGFWWSSTAFSTSNAWNMYVSNSDNYFYSGDRAKQYGISVRCLRD